MGRVTARRRASHLTADDHHPAGDPGRGGAVGAARQRRGDHRHDAHAGLRRRTGAGVSAHRGRGRPTRRHRQRRVLPGRRTDDGANTYNVLDVTLAPGVPMPDIDVTRNFYTTSSCGVCGKASIDAIRTISRHSPATTRPSSPPRRCPRCPTNSAARSGYSPAPAGCTAPRCSTPTAPCWSCARTSAGTTPSTR